MDFHLDTGKSGFCGSKEVNFPGHFPFPAPYPPSFLALTFFYDLGLIHFDHHHKTLTWLGEAPVELQ